jgi:hypothetical protein
VIVLKNPYFEVSWKIHTRHEGVDPQPAQASYRIQLARPRSMTVNGVQLEEHDLFVLHPGERVDIDIHTEEIHVVCVKVPSIPADKELCERS